jgi:hypothetical protein
MGLLCEVNLASYYVSTFRARILFLLSSAAYSSLPFSLLLGGAFLFVFGFMSCSVLFAAGAITA